VPGHRRRKPATPAQHLVSYIALIDGDDGSSVLVDHVNAGRFLPAGGHVEADDHPADTGRREAREELGIDARVLRVPPQPEFLTVTVTVTRGIDAGRTDVSLWFVLPGRRNMPLADTTGEFRGFSWWTPAQVRAADPMSVVPHYLRFLNKLGL
jgi:8-oxo-dGTP diphosphatase